MPDRLVVFGSVGHAKVIVEAVLARSPGREIVLLDDAEESRGRSLLGIPVSGSREQLRSLPGAPIALGIGDNNDRARLIAWLRQEGRSLETVIHPAAVISASAKVDEGSFIAAGAIVIAEARIGAGSIINTGATVDHDCLIGEAAHIAPGVHLCGNVRIGARTLVGVGSAIRQGICVCDDVVLGAGSVVVRNIEDPGIFAGNPVRALSGLRS